VTAFRQGKEEGGLGRARSPRRPRCSTRLFGKTQKQQLGDIKRRSASSASSSRWRRPEFVRDETKEASQKRLNALLQQQAGIQHAMHEQGIAAQDRRALAGLTVSGPEATAQFRPGGRCTCGAGARHLQGRNAELDKQIAKLRNVGELEAYIEKLQEDRFKFLTPAQKQELTDKEALLLKLQGRDRGTPDALPLGVRVHHRDRTTAPGRTAGG
jgi:hypothetical protein